MGGFPIEKAKETMKLALDGLYPPTLSFDHIRRRHKDIVSGARPRTAANRRRPRRFSTRVQVRAALR